jgi:hypothetical protein
VDQRLHAPGQVDENLDPLVRLPTRDQRRDLEDSQFGSVLLAL